VQKPSANAPSSRKFYKRETIHGLLKRTGCRQSTEHTHPEKTFWVTPKGEPFDLVEPQYVSGHFDRKEKEFLYTAAYLSIFLLNWLQLMGGSKSDLNEVMDELGLLHQAKVRLVKETKH